MLDYPAQLLYRGRSSGLLNLISKFKPMGGLSEWRQKRIGWMGRGVDGSQGERTGREKEGETVVGM